MSDDEYHVFKPDSNMPVWFNQKFDQLVAHLKNGPVWSVALLTGTTIMVCLDGPEDDGSYDFDTRCSACGVQTTDADGFDGAARTLFEGVKMTVVVRLCEAHAEELGT